jgi:hypothetical protein
VTIRDGNGIGATATGTGGGVYVATEAIVTISNSTITANAAQSGGGLYAAGTLGLVSSTVSGNSASMIRLTSGVTKDRVTIIPSANEKADFYGGIFKLGQTKSKKPISMLTLVQTLTGCNKTVKALTAANTKKVKKRRLWGDGKGRFRTKGKHSAATVVGTKWLVEDRCTSTLTRVAPRDGRGPRLHQAQDRVGDEGQEVRRASPVNCP